MTKRISTPPRGSRRLTWQRPQGARPPEEESLDLERGRPTVPEMSPQEVIAALRAREERQRRTEAATRKELPRLEVASVPLSAPVPPMQPIHRVALDEAPTFPDSSSAPLHGEVLDHDNLDLGEDARPTLRIDPSPSDMGGPAMARQIVVSGIVEEARVPTPD